MWATSHLVSTKYPETVVFQMRLELGREGKRNLLLFRIKIWFNKVYNHSTGTLGTYLHRHALQQWALIGTHFKGRGYIPVGLDYCRACCLRNCWTVRLHHKICKTSRKIVTAFTPIYTHLATNCSGLLEWPQVTHHDPTHQRCLQIHGNWLVNSDVPSDQ